MCKFNLSQMTNPALVPALLQLGYAMWKIKFIN